MSNIYCVCFYFEVFENFDSETLKTDVLHDVDLGPLALENL